MSLESQGIVHCGECGLYYNSSASHPCKPSSPYIGKVKMSMNLVTDKRPAEPHPSPDDLIKNSYYHQYKLDVAPPVPYGGIQWKGTNVCIDIHCTCGAHLHADEEFLYHVRCGKCKKLWHVSGYVKLLPVEGDDLKRYEASNFNEAVELNEYRE